LPVSKLPDLQNALLCSYNFISVVPNRSYGFRISIVEKTINLDFYRPKQKEQQNPKKQ
jgi:hypothetical protein